MDKICVEYQVTVSDFRRATYFVLYAIAGAAGVGTVNPLVLFLAAAYLVWGLMLFAGVEKGIRAYLRTKDSFIGCTYRMELESHRIRLNIPDRKIEFATPVNKLACVFEISSLFLIYTTLQDVYILPVRALTAEQRTALRANFRNKLGNNFGSRFR